MKKIVPALALAATAAAASMASAAAITSGDLIVYRVGATGSTTALATAGTAVFLDEYTTTGTLVQSIPITSAGAAALTATGSSGTEGAITPSQDGTKLVFTGYRADAGTATATELAAATARVAGTVDLTGTVDTSFSQTGFAANSAIRSATTVSGSGFYVGASTGVFNAATSGGTAFQIDTRNSRQVFLATYGTATNNLFASNGSTTVTAKVQSYGNLPTATNTTPAAVITTASANAIQGIYFLDESATVAGVDTLYYLDTVATTLNKATFDGTTWTVTGSVSSAATNLTAILNGTSVSLYLTSASTLSTLTDASGYGGTLTGTTAAIATAATNTGFRGVGSLVAAPTAAPEPTTLAAVAGLGLVGFVRRRRA